MNMKELTKGVADKKMLEGLKDYLVSIHAELEMQTYLKVMETYKIDDLKEAMVYTEKLFNVINDED